MREICSICSILSSASICSILSSAGCAIEDPDTDTVIITGGTNSNIYYNGTIVSVYNEHGWQRDLPNLNQQRIYHACSSYLSNEGDRVRVRADPYIQVPFSSCSGTHGYWRRS